MGKKVYAGIGGKARLVKSIYVGVDGKARKVKKAYIGIDGKARQFWPSLMLFTISASVNPSGSGTVSGAGTYEENSYASLFASPNQGYIFNSWKEAGSTITTNPSFRFQVRADKSFTANFERFQWTEAAIPNRAFSGICYGGGVFVACDSNNRQYIYSSNGVSWSDSNELSGYGNRAIAYGSGKFVSPSFTGSGGFYSSDGKTWTRYYGCGNNGIDQIVYGGGKFLATDDYPADSIPYVSSDGLTWNQGNALPMRAAVIAYGDGRFVALDGSGSTYSTNGTTWSGREYVGDIPSACAAYGNGVFVSLGSGTSIGISTDGGVTWTILNGVFPSSYTFKAITYGNGRFVAVGDNGVFATSVDGYVWQAGHILSGSSSDQWYGVAYGNGKFVAVGYSGGKHTIAYVAA